MSFPTPLFARSLSLLSILLVLRPGLLLIARFLSKTGIGFLSLFDHLPTPNATFRKWWHISVLAESLLALVLLIWSLLLRQERGTRNLSSAWKLLTFMVVGICLFVIVYAFLSFFMLSLVQSRPQLIEKVFDLVSSVDRRSNSDEDDLLGNVASKDALETNYG